MKRLTILRHAKASPGPDDFARPLTARGREQARRIGAELERREAVFDHVAASPAARVRETLESLDLAGLPKTRFDEALYMASSEALLQVIDAFPDSIERALIVGHNPGLHELVLELARPGPLTGRVEARFPTAATAIIALPCDRWEQVTRGSGELVALILPDEPAD